MAAQSEVCDFGRAAPDFRLRTADGVTYGRDDLMGKKGLLVAFICNHCPYVQTVIDRLAADIEVLQGIGIGVGLIMPNDYTRVPDDAPEAMARFAVAHGLRAPYLVDEDQSTAQAYSAVCTPEFFGYNAAGALQYRGRLDNIGMHGDASARVPELLNAMRRVAETGAGPVEQVASMGCSIKWR